MSNIFINSLVMNGCHPHFRQFTRKKIMLETTGVRSKLPALKPLSENLLTHHLHSNKTVWYQK